MAVAKLTSRPRKQVSVKDRVSEAEWKVRTDLAAAYHLAAIFGWTDVILTHFSARVPGGDEHFLLNAYGLMFDEVTASNLVKVDHEGNIIEDITGMGVNQAGFVIHGCVHAARPDAQAVLHTHTRAGIAVSAMAEGVLPLSQHSMRIVKDVTYHDYEGIALDMDERERLARNLGPTSRSMVLRNHGLLALGGTVPDAFMHMYFFEQTCRIQVDAMAAGRDRLTLVPESAIERTRAQVNRPRERKDWPALLRMLDRRQADFRS
ncbi:MAG TPA: class II aldolase/adducin family protein [Burkholderiales bacterium]|jgi:ribulose-5-phosphate 4-epimerase/fuculose-1-phosphate aldolase|nr:class II aldolase/adducin family protein [Burkholderiales bacterium]